jgi:hypothetical protein
MKIDVCFKAKNYRVEYNENLEVKEIIGAIRQKNKIKKSKKLLFCNEYKSFDEEEKLGQIHDEEFFFIVELSEIKKPKNKKQKREDIAEIIKKCTGAKEKLEQRYFIFKNNSQFFHLIFFI